MRILLIALGVISIATYAVVGAFMMNDWAVVAASEAPLETVVADMKTADESYSPVPGYIFAAIGAGLAILWAVIVGTAGARLPSWAAVTLWALILAGGAPAYFFSSFPNLNSVGDVYPDWNSEAAWALEKPLYLASLIALGIALIAPIFGIVAARRRKGSQRSGQTLEKPL